MIRKRVLQGATAFALGWSVDSPTFGCGGGAQRAGYVHKLRLIYITKEIKNWYDSFCEIAGGNAGSLVGVAISASLLPPVVNSVIYFEHSFFSCSLNSVNSVNGIRFNSPQ